MRILKGVLIGSSFDSEMKIEFLLSTGIKQQLSECTLLDIKKKLICLFVLL